MNAPAPNSPCISVCNIGPQGWCQGCYRTLDEIAGWMRFDATVRRAVLEACEARRAVAAATSRRIGS